MQKIKFRGYVEHKRKDSPNFMNYEPEFNGSINEIFNGNLQSPGTKITYMQYTGVNDKNGKEIYEGDIIKFSSFQLNSQGKSICHYLLVTFDAEKAAFCAGSYSWDQVKLRGEVIGNKYENPELFKKVLDRYQEKINEAEHAILPISDIDTGDGELNEAIITTWLNISRVSKILEDLKN